MVNILSKILNKYADTISKFNILQNVSMDLMRELDILRLVVLEYTESFRTKMIEIASYKEVVIFCDSQIRRTDSQFITRVQYV